MCIRDRFNSPLKYSPHLFLTLSSPPIPFPSSPLILSPNPSSFFPFLLTSFQNILLPDSKFSVTLLHHSPFALLFALSTALFASTLILLYSSQLSSLLLPNHFTCLLYTSDAADERSSV